MNKKLVLLVSAGLVVVAGAAGGGYYYLRRSDPMQRATQLIAAGNLRAAQVELRNAIRAQPRDAEAHLQMAKLQMKLADPVAAEIEFRAARAVGADPAQIAPLLGEALLAQGAQQGDAGAGAAARADAGTGDAQPADAEHRPVVVERHEGGGRYVGAGAEGGAGQRGGVADGGASGGGTQ